MLITATELLIIPKPTLCNRLSFLFLSGYWLNMKLDMFKPHLHAVCITYIQADVNKRK